MCKLRDILQVLLLCVFWGGALSACSDKELYSTPEDLAGANVGLLNVELPKDSLLDVMPGAEFEEYGKFMQLFLDLNAGRCDAAVVDSVMAVEATGKNSEYVLIGNVCGTYYYAVVHESRCGYREQYGESLWGNTLYLAYGVDVEDSSVKCGPRINVDYAEEDALLPYRFCDVKTGHLSAKI